MNILVLEHPRLASEKRFNDIANTPLWSCLMGGYAAASLEQHGFDTVFLDHAVPGAAFEMTQETILAHNPDLLCVNAVYFWEHTPVLLELFTALKRRGFSGHINLFGFFPSLVYRDILRECDPVDSIAVGEFELTLVELAHALEKGRSLERIEGLAVRACLANNTACIRTPEKHPDKFAFPKRNALDGTVSILASRGCYNHCSFCPVPSFYNQGSLWRGRSPENIVREIQALADLGVTDFYFVDPNFIGPGKSGKKRILDLMALLAPLKITFGMETRPRDLDDELLDALVASGFNSLLMGVESGSAAVLNQINKSCGSDMASQAISLCRNHGIEPEIGFLMFVPDSRLEDLLENMNFLAHNHLLDRLERTANLLSHTQIVLAGTSGYAGFEQENRLVKQGVFGFEAEVVFTHPEVKWVADHMTLACHMILKSMSDGYSPIFWKNSDPQISQQANDYLVDLGFDLISFAGNPPEHPDHDGIPSWKKAISDQINAILS